MSDKKVILCVDDEADILDLFCEEFLDHGFDVLKAENGILGVEVFNANKVDCIVTDIRMPAGDGVDMVKKLKEKGVDVPIFLVTGFSDYSTEELYGLGVNAIIFKPFDMDEIVDMVKAHLDRQESS